MLGEVHRLDVADDQPVQGRTGLLSGFGIDLDARHHVAGASKDPGQVAGGAAHVEDPLALTDECRDYRL